jgi:hypothetical protein
VIETREEVTRALLVCWWLRSAIEAEQGAIRMAPLARELGLSQDALEKRLRRAVGASPKQFASSCRPSAATTADELAGREHRGRRSSGHALVRRAMGLLAEQGERRPPARFWARGARMSIV